MYLKHRAHSAGPSQEIKRSRVQRSGDPESAVQSPQSRVQGPGLDCRAPEGITLHRGDIGHLRLACGNESYKSKLRKYKAKRVQNIKYMLNTRESGFSPSGDQKRAFFSFQVSNTFSLPRSEFRFPCSAPTCGKISPLVYG